MDKQTVNKKIKSRRKLSFTEITYEDGSQELRPDTADFNDFELLGILAYFKDVFTVKMIKENNTNPQQ